MRDEGDGRRRFVRAAVIGSLLALVADVTLLAAGSSGLTGSGGAPSLLIDVQARAMAHGHFAVSAGQAGIEGFVTHGRTYLYFGPLVSLLHLPFLLVGGHGVDGHLTQLSMVGAYVVLLVAVGVLHWQVRALLRPGAAFGRTDAAAALLIQLAVGAGAVPLYLAGWVAVYHEVELWGAALSLAALAALVALLRAPSVRGVVRAGALATLAVNTRVSVGLGVVAAMAVVAIALAAARVPVLRSFAPAVPGALRGRLIAGLTVGALVATVSSAAINELKFDQPFGLPLQRQVYSHVDPAREAALAANPGGLFGGQFVPTTLLAYLRPDAVGLERGFPFVSTPAAAPTVVGGERFDTLEQSLSATTSMLLLVLLSLVALVGLLRAPARRPLLGVLVASSAGFAGALTLAYVTTRYLADLLPTLVVGAAAGLQLAIARVTVGGRRAHRGRRLLLAGVGTLVAVGFVVNGSTGLLAQQLLHPQTPAAARAAFLTRQDDIDRFLGRAPHGLRHGAVLPATAPGAPGDLFVVGDCAGLYETGSAGGWLDVERTSATGLHRLAVIFPASTGGRWQSLVTIGRGPSALTVQARGTAAAMRFRARSIARGPQLGVTLAVPAGRAVAMVISTAPLFGTPVTTVTVSGRQVIFTGAPAVVPAATVARSPAVHIEATPTPVCRTLTRRAGLRL